MTKEALIEKLKELQEDKDYERAHIQEDELLMEYLDDDISIEFKKVGKWYS